ncbi:MAG: tRNA (guanosine(46)-N7)-methyltransferase TrmB [Burkholderiaceae bacterium]
MTEATPAPAEAASGDDFRDRHIRSFGTRRGHMTAGQRDAFERLSPTLTLPFTHTPLDLAQVFDNTQPVTLEIGCGMGETTASIAAAHPERNYLGLEVYPAGVGSLLGRIESAGLQNVRVISHDAVEVLQYMIRPGTLAATHIYFPDPWHKKRHHKRRLIQPAFIALLVSRLAPGGLVHCATDWVAYAEQMLEVLSAEPGLENTVDGYLPRPDFRPMTKFEKRGLALGHEVRDLIFKRLG